jgi:membrane protease YdiL (CAAX protease family)
VSGPSVPPEGRPPYGPPPGYPPHPQQPPAYAQQPPAYSQQPPTASYGAIPPVPAARRPSFPHAEPQEYHLMLRTWTYAWWRPVVGVILLALGMIIVVPILTLPVLVVGVLIQGGKQDFLDAFLQAGTLEKLTPAGLLYLNLTLAALVLWTWGLVRVLHNLRPRWLASVVPKLRWKFLFACLGLSVVALVAQLVVSLVVPTDQAPDSVQLNSVTGTTVALALVVLFTTPLQAAGEEYVFRGYLLQAVGSLTRRKWPAILVSATLFACAHGLQNPPLFFDRFMFGLIAAWLVIRTGGLEAGIALHVLNNFLAFGLAIAVGDISQTLNVTEVSWWNIPVTLTQSLVYVALVLWVGRKMGLQTTTRPPLPAPPSTPPGTQRPPVPEPA